MKNLFNDKAMNPACGYCERGKTTADGKSVLCIHKGVMQLSGCCKHFTYNPLKREPKMIPDLIPCALEEFVI